VAFQAYVKALRDRGVLLAVASKNEMENARAPFRDHADMVLKEDDIACFVANWEPKDGSLRTIAERLNIGLDALVFFDDNPVERQLVRDSLPEVTVVDVPADPSSFVSALDETNLFETLSVTQEDRIRTAFFQQNERREQLESSASNYDDFLKQLEMRAVIEPVSLANLTRVVQLINKTNQFNLTTLRMTEADVKGLVDHPLHYTSTIRLDDKFGSNGLISVVIGQADGEALTLTTWLMSCRVLKRGVENLELQRIVEFCRRRGLSRVFGRYRPTEKNKLVQDHYAGLGFREVAGEPGGTTWCLDLSQGHAGRTHWITVERES
jgi:FkbH-like protein